MLSIQPQSHPKKVTPNILPCTIKHNGPIHTAERYWSPTTTAGAVDETSTAYFRGRKLQGRKIALPAGYTGAVLQKTDKLVMEKPERAAVRQEEDDEDMMEGAIALPEKIETRVMEQQSSFGEIMVWGHEAVPEDGDMYVKALQEWIGFAAAVSCCSTEIMAVRG